MFWKNGNDRRIYVKSSVYIQNYSSNDSSTCYVITDSLISYWNANLRDKAEMLIF